MTRIERIIADEPKTDWRRSALSESSAFIRYILRRRRQFPYTQSKPDPGRVVSPRGRVIANNPIVTGNRVEYNTTADEPSVEIESINCRWVSRFPLRHGTYLRCVCLKRAVISVAN